MQKQTIADQLKQHIQANEEEWNTLWGNATSKYKGNYFFTLFTLAQMNEKVAQAYFALDPNDRPHDGLLKPDEYLFKIVNDYDDDYYSYPAELKAEHFYSLSEEVFEKVKTKMMEILAKELRLSDYLGDPILPDENHTEWMTYYCIHEFALTKTVCDILIKGGFNADVAKLLFERYLYEYLMNELLLLIPQAFQNIYKQKEFIKDGKILSGEEVFTRKWKCQIELTDENEVEIIPENKDFYTGYLIASSSDLWEILEKCLLNDFQVQLN